jgi:hypothetical protein
MPVSFPPLDSVEMDYVNAVGAMDPIAQRQRPSTVEHRFL